MVWKGKYICASCYRKFFLNSKPIKIVDNKDLVIIDSNKPVIRYSV